MELLSALHTPNEEHSFGVPRWYDLRAVRKFQAEISKITTSGPGFSIGYRISGEHNKAQIFLAMSDEAFTDNVTASLIAQTINNALNNRSIDRCEAWVPGWNSYAINILKQCMNYEGKLPGILFGFNKWWDVNIFGVTIDDQPTFINDSINCGGEK